jgi:hypothetical protein
MLLSVIILLLSVNGYVMGRNPTTVLSGMGLNGFLIGKKLCVITVVWSYAGVRLNVVILRRLKLLGRV